MAKTKFLPWLQQHLDRRQLILLGVVLLCIVGIMLAWTTFRPRTIAYQYGGNSCDQQITILPDTVRSTGRDYTLETQGKFTVGSLPIVATKVCAVALQPPDTDRQSKLQLRALGGIIPLSSYTVRASERPTITSTLSKPVSAKRPLMLALSESDATFAYKLHVGDRAADCDVRSHKVACDIAKLNLTQGERQNLVIKRSFNTKPVDTPLDKNVDLQAPTRITASSVAADATIYDTPKKLTIATDKPLSLAEAKFEKIPKEGAPEQINAKTLVVNNEVTIEVADDLPRETTFRLTLDVVARDGSSFTSPLVLPFKTSGGPAVTNVSAGSSGYVPGTPITITFDQPLKADMDIAKFVALKDISGTMAIRGQQLIITPQAVGRCASFEITVKKGLLSQYGIASSTDWSMTSRARCYSTETVGTSANGRPITAYFFGNGGSYILYTGAIHGNELSSKYTMESWISELDAKASTIPADKTLVIIPVMNPDGAVIGQRNNARGVNLNRNFPTYNWEKDIVTGGGRKAGEGGASAGSEPETQVLMRLTQRLSPTFIVTFHSSGALVNSNDAGSSVAKGQQYASLAGYRFISNAATTGTFGFEMTGTYEDWLLERGVPAILIELNTNTGNHFSQNRAALWSTTR